MGEDLSKLELKNGGWLLGEEVMERDLEGSRGLNKAVMLKMVMILLKMPGKEKKVQPRNKMFLVIL